MSEPALTAAPQPHGEAALRAALDALRSAGAQRLDPVRFHYIEQLFERMQAQPAEVCRILEGRLGEALADYGERFGRMPSAAAGAGGKRRTGAKAAPAAACAPLAELNRRIREARRPGVDGGALGEAQAGAELASVRRFRQLWATIHTEDQLARAAGRAPENAGPLNSHRLLLRTLALMDQLSPDYLQRFLAQVDTLLWLDQAGEKYLPKVGKPAARRGRQKQ